MHQPAATATCMATVWLRVLHFQQAAWQLMGGGGGSLRAAVASCVGTCGIRQVYPQIIYACLGALTAIKAHELIQAP